MPATKKAIPTYTHTGYRPHTGYRHMSVDANHYSPEPGKTHALNVEGDHFRSLCGEHIDGKYDSDRDFCDEVGLGEFRTANESENRDGSDVSCARCRKILKVQRWAVQCLCQYSGRWQFVKDHTKFATKAEAETAMAALEIRYPGNALRVRMK